MCSLLASTEALESGSSSNDSTYTNLEDQLISITSQRDALAAQMIALLEGAAFHGQVINPNLARVLIAQAQALLNQVCSLP